MKYALQSVMILYFIYCHSSLQLLIGFEGGTIVQWDLRAKKADFRIYYDEVRSIPSFNTLTETALM